MTFSGEERVQLGNTEYVFQKVLKSTISGLAVVILLGVLFILFIYIVNWMNLYLYINNKA